MIARAAAVLALALTAASSVTAADWLRPGGADSRPIWGIPGGIRFAIAPGSVEGPDDGGPRGLIRVGYPAVGGDGYVMVNFIAIEPVVGGKRGLSELEKSPSDGQPGKKLAAVGAADPGKVETPADGAERLQVRIDIEKFENGAHIYVVASLRADRPNEIHFTVHALPDSAPIEECVLSATMGNKARVRLVEMRSGVLSSKDIFGGYNGPDFTGDHFEGADKLARNAEGDVVVPFSSDERDPASVHPFPDNPFTWYYPGKPLTQYWRKPANTPQDGLKLRVNGRFQYWMSEQPIPGGVAFENVELRDKFKDGEQWVFGMTPDAPRQVIDDVPPRP